MGIKQKDIKFIVYILGAFVAVVSGEWFIIDKFVLKPNEKEYAYR